MAIDPCNVESLLISVVHGAYHYGLPSAVSYELSVQDLVVRGEGGIGPACATVIGSDLTCVCSFLVQPPQCSDVGPADLVISTYMGNGNIMTHTLKNMVSRGFAWEMNREAPPAMGRQSFRHVGNMQSPGDSTADTTNAAVNPTPAR